MKLGSSRGTDTRRPRGSERSKPRHKLRLTRPSQRPYPGPPEQAQPGVSEPCRTTRNKCGELHDCLLATPGGLCWPFDRGGPACCRGFDEGRVPAKRSARIDEIGGYKVLDGTSQTLACRGDHDPSAKLCKSQARLQGHG